MGTLSGDSGNVIQLIEEAYAVRFSKPNKTISETCKLMGNCDTVTV